MEQQGKGTSFTSRMTKPETAAALLYLPIHIILLPAIANSILENGVAEAARLNLYIYLIGLAYMLILLGRFLRREFDPLCDRFLRCVIEVLTCYCLMLCLNLAAAAVLTAFGGALENPNNEAIIEMADVEFGKISAIAIFLAPIVEELMFRGGIFGFMRRYSRAAAYISSMLLFSLYHVWGYALGNPMYWIYIVQYLPVSYLLCRCYERSNTLWASIFLHMLINGISIRALSML